MHTCVRCVSKLRVRCGASRPCNAAICAIRSDMMRAFRIVGDGSAVPLLPRSPSRDHRLGRVVGLTAIELHRDCRVSTATAIGKPCPNGPFDCALHMFVQCLGLERIKVRGHAGTEDQPAQRKRSIPDPLARTIDPAEARGSMIEGEGRPLRPVPVFQRGTVGLAVVVIGEKLSDERTDVSRSAPIGDEVQTDSLRRTKKAAEPAKGFSEYVHDSTSPEDVKGKGADGTLPTRASV